MLIWIAFLGLIGIFLLLDLGVFNKKSHVIKTKEAAIWTLIWVSFAMAFSFVIHWLFRNNLIANPTNITADTAVLKYITGYLIELSLSIDNVFVIAVIFTSFKIPLIYQHRVLFWGIIGAIAFRAIMIVFGVALINNVDWIVYVFGVFLIYTAFKMYRSEGLEFDPKKSFFLRIIKRFVAYTPNFHEEKFFIHKRGIRVATPLFLALLIIELTDVLFALDSIPAILAITSNPFIVFSSNILAVLGLRSMYFLLSRMLVKFRYINYSLMVILAFVGIKMIISHFIELPELLSLGVIVTALLSGILASIMIKAPPTDELE